MTTLLLIFLAWCSGAIALAWVAKIRALGLKLNVYLLAFSLVAFAAWLGMETWSPATTISEHWLVFRISFAGFLSMLLSLTAAIRYFIESKSRRVMCGIVIAASFVLAAIHFLDMILSIPVS